MRRGPDLAVCTSDGTSHPGPYIYAWDAATLKGHREGRMLGDACGKASSEPIDANDPFLFTYQVVGQTSTSATAAPPEPKTTIPGEGTPPGRNRRHGGNLHIDTRHERLQLLGHPLERDVRHVSHEDRSRVRRRPGVHHDSVGRRVQKRKLPDLHASAVTRWTK
jgi:hypothetical protein